MKKAFLAAVAAMAGFTAMADTEEIMVVRLADGSTVEYPVETVQSLRFETRTITEPRRDMVVIPHNGTTTVVPEINALLRCVPTEAGQPVEFAFSDCNSADPAEIAAQARYAVKLAVSPSRVYGGNIDLVDESEAYVLQLLEYTDGEAKRIFSKVSGGNLSTEMDRKRGTVTINIDAAFDDGTQLQVHAAQVPVDVESLKAMIPDHKFSNEVFYYNSDGNMVSNPPIVSASSRDRFWSRLDCDVKDITLELDGYVNGEDSGTITISKETLENLPEDGLLNLDSGHNVYIAFGPIQLYSVPTSNPSYNFFNVVDNGTLQIRHNDDGTWFIHLDVTNYYKSNGSDRRNGTNERIVLHYEGAID